MREYTVIYERGDTNQGAIVPDLPGCVSIDDTYEEVQQNVKEAVDLYLEVLTEKGMPIPEVKHTARTSYRCRRLKRRLEPQKQEEPNSFRRRSGL